MTVLLRRLNLEQVLHQLDASRGLSISELAARMPVTDVVTTASPFGGAEITAEELRALRTAVVDLAREHGYPAPGSDLPRFDAGCARVLEQLLALTPYEASEEEAWSHLTCCWLLDVAAWRWRGGLDGADVRRFRGDVNRNTFRRLWWRAAVLGPEIDLTLLGEDVLVNVMERPAISSDRRLTRALVRHYLETLESHPSRAMMLMREASKRLLRLTPIIDFHSLSADELDSLIAALMVSARTGAPLSEPDKGGAVPQANPHVVTMRRSTDAPDALPSHPDDDAEYTDGVSAVAIGIARRTGRVTNSALREVVPVDALASRQVLQSLVDRGLLARRGRAKGTYYVIPQLSDGDGFTRELDAEITGVALRRALQEHDG